MPHIVIWSPRAIEDVKRAYIFLVSKDLAAAQAAVESIYKQTNILEAFPNAGRPAEDLEPEQRELLVPFGPSGYIILYHFDKAAQVVGVVAVKHQKEVGY